mgnify:CR=1 FL=1
MTYTFTTSNNKTYYLNRKNVKLTNGTHQDIWFFTPDYRESTNVASLPAGYIVKEMKRTHFPVIKKEVK